VHRAVVQEAENGELDDVSACLEQAQSDQDIEACLSQ